MASSGSTSKRGRPISDLIGLISDLRCPMCSSFRARVWGPMWWPMSSMAVLLHSGGVVHWLLSLMCSILVLLYLMNLLLFFLFLFWKTIYCFGFFRLNCNQVHWVLILWFFFFFLDWVCNLLFRIDVGLFIPGGLALLYYYFFFGLKVEQIIFFFLRVFLILVEGVPNFF